MGFGTESSSLLKKVINKTNTGYKIVGVTSVAGILQVARISQGLKKPALSKNEKDRFYFEILREQFREIKFFLRQVIQNQNSNTPSEVINKNVSRLKLSLSAMDNTLKGMDESLLTEFFESLKSEGACWLFIIGAFTDSSNHYSEFFKTFLVNELINKHQLSELEIKSLELLKSDNLSFILKQTSTTVTDKMKKNLDEILINQKQTTRS